jgi:creatinine amidohydrolase/Fe(II)-dependent formamide hydrolase-like protein
MRYFKRLLLLPLGSYEYHGRELPPTTDSIVAERVADAVAERLSARGVPGIERLPIINYGLSLEHKGNPNTAFVYHSTYYAFVNELMCSFAMARDLVVFVNGHGGNVNTINAIEADYNYGHADSKLLSLPLFAKPVMSLCTELFGEFDAHAGSVEASLMAFYRQEKFREYEVPVPRMVRGVFRFFRTADVTSSGVIKERPRVIADPIKGERVHEEVVEHFSDSVVRISEELERALT